MLGDIMNMKPVALECVIGGSCNFKTIELEFAQAFQLLELHMKYLHSPTANRDGDKISNHDDDPEEDNFESEHLKEERELEVSDTICQWSSKRVEICCKSGENASDSH